MCSSKPFSVILLAGALALVSVGSAEAQGQHARPRSGPAAQGQSARPRTGPAARGQSARPRTGPAAQGQRARPRTGPAVGRAVPRPSGRVPYRAPAVRNYRPYSYGSYYRPYYRSYYRSYYYRPYYSYYYSPYYDWASFGWPYYGTSFGFSLAFGYPGYYYPYPGYVAPYNYPGYPYGGAYPGYTSYPAYQAYPSDPSYPAEETAPPADAGAQVQPGGFGTLSIQVRPAGAEILVDGASWQGPDGSDRLVLQLSVGRHRVEITKDGYQAYAADVEVRAGETTPLNVSVPRKQAP